MGDRLRAGKLSRYVTSHPGQLSLAIPLWVGGISTSLGWEGNRRSGVAQRGDEHFAYAPSEYGPPLQLDHCTNKHSEFHPNWTTLSCKSRVYRVQTVSHRTHNKGTCSNQKLKINIDTVVEKPERGDVIDRFEFLFLLYQVRSRKNDCTVVGGIQYCSSHRTYVTTGASARRRVDSLLSQMSLTNLAGRATRRRRRHA